MAEPDVFVTPVRSMDVTMNLDVTVTEEMRELLVWKPTTRTITVTLAEGWPPAVKKGAPIELSTVLFGITYRIKGIVQRRWVHKVVIEGTIEQVTVAELDQLVLPHA